MSPAAPVRVPIESLCEAVTSGGTPSRADPSFWEDGVIPWLKTGELKDWYIDDAEEKITAKALAQSSAKVFPPNTVLMAMYGDGKTITSLGILRNEASTNQACCAMIADPQKTNFLYLFYALKYHRHELLKLVVAGAQRNLSGGIIKKFAINWFSLPTQNRIAEKLRAYDDLIENNRRRMALLEESARLLYNEWFVRLHFPGHEHTPIVDGVPQGWQRKALGQCITLNYGKALKAEDRVDGDVPVYGSSGIVGSHDKPLVKGPAIVLGRKGNVGSVYWSSKSFHPIDTVYFVNAESSSLYLYYALKQMHFISTDVAVPGLNRDFAYSRLLLLPASTILRSFVETVTPIHAQLDKLDEMNQKLRAARDLLLPRLMSGELIA
ncbi:restriction endonuclease subunit S [Aquabacterium sp.]|jgi:type I restriction enzyme S subunit|uniref:restriction endonuclease subunit S n=1 Tax=Aquabacterium sp. TaxID=1872578 RepID=UPI0027B8BF4F|nr:restriction endonuclease subunit S [Aquabacterium sp.]